MLPKLIVRFAHGVPERPAAQCLGIKKRPVDLLPASVMHIEKSFHFRRIGRMTALSGGEQLDDELTPLNSVLERPDRGAGGAQRGPRSLDEIFPLRGDVTRRRQMQVTWRAFGDEMEDTVRLALDNSRSPPATTFWVRLSAAAVEDPSTERTVRPCPPRLMRILSKHVRGHLCRIFAVRNWLGLPAFT